VMLRPAGERMGTTSSAGAKAAGGAAAAAITPERVREMAAVLGIALEHPKAADNEYYLLWLAVEALCAPLPSGWSASSTGFEHVVMRKTTREHPLLPVFRDQLAYERKRSTRRRPWSKVESFMLFSDPSAAGADAGAAIYFYDFRTGVRSAELPQEVFELSNQRLLEQAKATGARQPSAALRKIKARKVQAEQAAASAEAATQQESHALLAELRALCARSRSESLTLRPRPLPELMGAARSLRINLVQQPQLVWLVDSLLCLDHLPTGWEELGQRTSEAMGVPPPRKRLSPHVKLSQQRLGASIEPRFYVNHLSLSATDQHPMVSIAAAIKAVAISSGL